MKYISADYVYPVTSNPLKNGIISVNDDGTIENIYHHDEAPDDAKIEKFAGVLVPGFINAHCHSELSYLKDKIKPGGGLPAFIKEILEIRYKFDEAEIKKAAAAGIKEMEQNGIVAVADITNDDFSFEAKEESKIIFHSLLEVFDIVPERAEEVIKNAWKLADELMVKAPGNCSFSIVPHAPYTVTPALLKLLDVGAYENNFLISIHNQETPSENQLFLNKTGALATMLEGMGDAMKHFKPTGFNSLQSILVQLPRCNKVLLVHNTYTETNDIRKAHQYTNQLFWCFCPNANLYIENKLPHFENFFKSNVTCCLGTDSYASNHSLSILDEMKTIAKHSHKISFPTLLQWATINGAKYLGLQKTIGSFEVGKKPGINLIENFSFDKMQLNEKSTVRRIV